MKINVSIYRAHNGWRVDGQRADDYAPYIGVWLATDERIDYWLSVLGQDHEVTITKDERIGAK